MLKITGSLKKSTSKKLEIGNNKIVKYGIGSSNSKLPYY